MDTRLIIVEGVMGSGKSTLSAWITRQLCQHGYAAEHVPERFSSHPTSVTRTLPHWRKIWLDISNDAFIAQSQANWRKLVESALTSSTIYVFDGQFFHGDMTNLMIANTPRHQLTAYIDSLAEILQPLQPTFIYLYQQDVSQALEGVAHERGASWLRLQIDWKVKSLYGAQHGYQGLAGWLQLYRDFRLLTDELYERLPMRKVAIENSAQEWQQYEVQVLDFLGLNS